MGGKIIFLDIIEKKNLSYQLQFKKKICCKMFAL